MTFFFLVIGLEAKREFDVGQLRERRRVALPLSAALGGMAGAVAVYLAFNLGGDGDHGWGASMSTDTAFALGVLALVAPGGTRLRVALLTVAVFDDLVALGVIAIVYTDHISMTALLVAAGLYAAIVALRYAPENTRRSAAAVLGVAFWGALHESGVDPIIAGLAVGLVTSAYPPPRDQLERVDGEHAHVQGAADAAVGPQRAAERRGRDLAQRPPPVPPPPVDELRDRAAVRARQRRHPHRRRPARGRGHLPDHARHLLRLRRGQAGGPHRRRGSRSRSAGAYAAA